MINQLRITKTRDVKTPHRGTPLSAGLDLFVPEDIRVYEILEKNPAISIENITTDLDPREIVEYIMLQPSEGLLIPTGIHFDIPNNYMIRVSNKSGIASKYGLLIGATCCDADYEGIVHINVWNVSNEPRKICAGMKLAQAILIPVEYPEVVEVENVEELYTSKNSSRGSGGFGSTGK